MSDLEIVGIGLLIVFMVWVWRLKPDPHAGYTHYSEQLVTDSAGGPVGCIPYMIVIALVIGVVLVYMMWTAKPF